MIIPLKFDKIVKVIKENAKSNPETDSPKAVAKVMMRTLFSTTWRIFVPVTVLFIIGLAIDLNATTKPWGMAIGTSLGIVVAIVLVALQLKSIRQETAQLHIAKGEK